MNEKEAARVSRDLARVERLLLRAQEAIADEINVHSRRAAPRAHTIRAYHVIEKYFDAKNEAFERAETKKREAELLELARAK